MKKLEDLVFTDDYMFGAVLRDEELCIGVLERLLKIRIEKIEYPELQKAIKVGYEVHGIRLDVYVKDSDTVYDIEMQNTDLEALGKRTRFYQSLIDADYLLKGSHYSDLVESKIIFICKKDPFNKGLQVYSFKNLCTEDNSLELNDKTEKLLYNASSYNNEPNAELKAFMHYILTNEPTDSFTEKLTNKVLHIKESETFRTEYLKMYIGMEDEKRRAVKEAVKEAVSETQKETTEKAALGLLKLGTVSHSDIAKALELPLEYIEELAKKE